MSNSSNRNDGYGLQPAEPQWEDRSATGVNRVVIRTSTGPTNGGLENAPIEQYRAEPGTHRIAIGGDRQVADYQQYQRVSVGSGPMVEVAGIMGTVQTPGGYFTSNPTANCTVEVPGGMRTSLKVAESLGLVRRNANGFYEDLTIGAPAGALQGNQQEPQQEPEEEHPDGPEVQEFPAEIEEIYGSLIADIPQPIYDSVLVRAALDAATTGRMEITAEQLASVARIPEGKAGQILQVAQQAFGMQANAVASARGIDPEEFFSWAREERMPDLKRAVREHMLARNLRGYRKLVREYQAKKGGGQ